MLFCQVWLKLPSDWGENFLNFVHVFLLLFSYYFHLGKSVSLYLNKLVSISPREALCQFWLKMAQWLFRKPFLKFVNVFSLFLYCIKGCGPSLIDCFDSVLRHIGIISAIYPHLKKLDSPSKCFMPSFVEEIGPLILEKKIWKFFSTCFCNFFYHFPLENGVDLHLNVNFNPLLTSKDAYKAWLKWAL